jgi:phosphoribosylformylglycinamidine synthase subunit PurS
MARVVVDVMPKPEILDPQGKAVTGALARLGFAGMSVRQGKRFEIELEGEVTKDRLEEVRRAAETLLANTVIETFDVRVEAPRESPDDDEPDDDQIETAEQSDQDEPTEQVELASTQAG